jgi:acetyl-CoA carboxylase alpha subunit
MANGFALDFERPIVELEQKIEELKKLPASKAINLADEIKRLEEKLAQAKRLVYEHLTPWQRVQLARHPKRPYTLDYVERLFTDFTELHGDRRFADDHAIIAGFACLNGTATLVVGHQKGRDTKQKIYRVLMQEYAIYSVIPPEGCAAILWRDAARKVEAAAALKITAPDLLALQVIDEIVPEPLGGAHTSHDDAARMLGEALRRALADVSAMSSETRTARRYENVRRVGNVGVTELDS